MDYPWICSCCGKRFNTLPLDVGYSSPDHWLAIPEAERNKRGKISDDLCIIDEKEFFIRGCLEIPIVGHNEKFVWGVWVSVSKESYGRILELWDASDLENEPPRFGWLCNDIAPYPSTLNLKTNVRLRSGGIRPLIELQLADHPLVSDQRNGISLKRVQDIVARYAGHAATAGPPE
jgi:hypothetical protein